MFDFSITYKVARGIRRTHKNAIVSCLHQFKIAMLYDNPQLANFTYFCSCFQRAKILYL